MESPQADFSIEGTGGLGTVFWLRPWTPRACDWIHENIPEDAQRLGNALAVEQRFMPQIVQGIVAAGLVLA